MVAGFAVVDAGVVSDIVVVGVVVGFAVVGAGVVVVVASVVVGVVTTLQTGMLIPSILPLYSLKKKLPLQIEHPPGKL